MITIDFQKVADAFEQSPAGIKNLMLSTDVAQKIEDIAILNNLPEDVFPTLVDEIGYVILGLKQRFIFEKSLIEAGIDATIANKIAKKTEEIIFPLIEEAKKEKTNPYSMDGIDGIDNDTEQASHLGISGWHERFFQGHNVSTEDMLDKSNIYEQTMQASRSKARDILPPYIESLKNEVVDSVLDPVWIERVGEISKKYSLSEDQSKMLSQNVFFALVGLQNPEQLEENVSRDLGISKIIAEQILLDVENRIFNYLSKQTSPKTETKITTTKAPEISLEKPITQISQESLLGSVGTKGGSYVQSEVPNYSTNRVVLEKEPVQSPIPTPKFKAVPMSDIESGQDFIPNLAPKPNAGGIMETKLNSVPKPIEEVKKIPTEKYDVDPYREPLN